MPALFLLPMNESKTEKTRRLSFVEKWGRAEETSASLRITLYVVILLCITLLAALVKTSLKPQPIYYIPSSQEAGIAYPNRIDKTAICGFASNWLLNRNNFTPATVKDTYSRIMRYMSPELLSMTKSSLDEEMLRVERDNISSLFSLKKDPELIESAPDYKVTLIGEKVLYMGKEKVDARMLQYTITLKKVPPIEINPYGLAIAGVKQEEAETR
jgi:hypothetical protein